MKYKELSRNRGEVFQLHPRPVAFDRASNAQYSIRNEWRLDDIIGSSGGVRLSSVTTRQQIAILHDNLHDYHSPNILWLKTQIQFIDGAVHYHPIPGHIGRTDHSAVFAITLPIGFSNDEWTSLYGAGAPLGKVVLAFTWLLESRCWLQPGEVEPAADGRWIFPTCHLNSLKDRYVAAIAVREDQVPEVRALFAKAPRDIRTVERELKLRGVDYQMTEPRRLQLIRLDDRAV